MDVMFNYSFGDMISEMSNLSFGGGFITGMIISMIVITLILLIACYIYRSIAWMKIAKNSKYKYPWLAWIPFANGAMRLQLGGFHWALIFLWLIPILGWIALWVLLIISHWRIFERFGYYGALSLIQLADIVFKGVGTLGYLIVIGFVAWKPKKKIRKK